MNDKEIEGVLGHEISHISNGDMVTMTLIQGVVNAFAMFFSRLLANVLASNVDEKYRGIVHFICVLIGDIAFTLLGSIVVNFYSRKREFRADAGSAKVSSPGNMIAALQRLQSLHEAPPSRDDAMATLKISGREKKGSIADLFMTHPALEDRIRALERGRIA
jgi:heat shock protein HtpX